MGKIEPTPLFEKEVSNEARPNLKVVEIGVEPPHRERHDTRTRERQTENYDKRDTRANSTPRHKIRSTAAVDTGALQNRLERSHDT